MAKLKSITRRLMARHRVNRRELGEGHTANSGHIRKQVAAETRRLRNSIGNRKYNKIVASQYRPSEK